jgi:hypothetical protein
VVLYSLGEIDIGANAVVSQHCYLCTGSHDYTKPTFGYLCKTHPGRRGGMAGDGCVRRAGRLHRAGGAQTRYTWPNIVDALSREYESVIRQNKTRYSNL